MGVTVVNTTLRLGPKEMVPQPKRQILDMNAEEVQDSVASSIEKAHLDERVGYVILLLLITARTNGSWVGVSIQRTAWELGDQLAIPISEESVWWTLVRNTSYPPLDMFRSAEQAGFCSIDEKNGYAYPTEKLFELVAGD